MEVSSHQKYQRSDFFCLLIIAWTNFADQWIWNWIMPLSVVNAAVNHMDNSINLFHSNRMKDVLEKVYTAVLELLVENGYVKLDHYLLNIPVYAKK